MKKGTKPTLYKLLRMYWKNGQNKGAIVDNYKNCGGKEKLGRKKLVDLRKIKDIEGRNKYNTTSKKILLMRFKILYESKENSLRYI